MQGWTAAHDRAAPLLSLSCLSARSRQSAHISCCSEYLATSAANENARSDGSVHLRGRLSAGTGHQPIARVGGSTDPARQTFPAQGELSEPGLKENARKEGKKAKSDNCEQKQNLVDAGLSPVVTCSRLPEMTIFSFNHLQLRFDFVLQASIYAASRKITSKTCRRRNSNR